MVGDADVRIEIAPEQQNVLQSAISVIRSPNRAAADYLQPIGS